MAYQFSIAACISLQPLLTSTEQPVASVSQGLPVGRELRPLPRGTQQRGLGADAGRRELTQQAMTSPCSFRARDGLLFVRHLIEFSARSARKFSTCWTSQTVTD